MNSYWFFEASLGSSGMIYSILMADKKVHIIVGEGVTSMGVTGKRILFLGDSSMISRHL